MKLQNMFGKFWTQLKGLNRRVVFLLMGILFITLILQFFMLRSEEGFQSAIGDALDKLDDESKQKIVNEIKSNVNNVSSMVQGQMDRVLPCMLKMDSCRQGLFGFPYSAGPVGSATTDNTNATTTPTPRTVIPTETRTPPRAIPLPSGPNGQNETSIPEPISTGTDRAGPATQ